MEQKKDRSVLIISAVIVAAFVIFGAVAPEAFNEVANVLFTVFTVDFGWLYLLVVFVMVIYAIAIGLSKFGNIKLGHDDDEPEFSNFSWFAQLFGGGMGIGLVFWSVAEPISDFMAPPSADPLTNEAMHEAMQTVFFHWGISPWVIFAVAGLALGYFAFRLDRPFLVSSAFEPLLAWLLVTSRSAWIARSWSARRSSRCWVKRFTDPSARPSTSWLCSPRSSA